MYAHFTITRCQNMTFTIIKMWSYVPAMIRDGNYMNTSPNNHIINAISRNHINDTVYHDYSHKGHSFGSSKILLGDLT